MKSIYPIGLFAISLCTPLIADAKNVYRSILERDSSEEILEQRIKYLNQKLEKQDIQIKAYENALRELPKTVLRKMDDLQNKLKDLPRAQDEVWSTYEVGVQTQYKSLTLSLESLKKERQEDFLKLTGLELKYQTIKAIDELNGPKQPRMTYQEKNKANAQAAKDRLKTYTQSVHRDRYERLVDNLSYRSAFDPKEE